MSCQDTLRGAYGCVSLTSIGFKTAQDRNIRFITKLFRDPADAIHEQEINMSIEHFFKACPFRFLVYHYGRVDWQEVLSSSYSREFMDTDTQDSIKTITCGRPVIHSHRAYLLDPNTVTFTVPDKSSDSCDSTHFGGGEVVLSWVLARYSPHLLTDRERSGKIDRLEKPHHVRVRGLRSPAIPLEDTHHGHANNSFTDTSKADAEEEEKQGALVCISNLTVNGDGHLVVTGTIAASREATHVHAIHYEYGGKSLSGMPVVWFDVHNTLCIIIDVLHTVDILMQNGWIHRDLKPANILFDHKRPIARVIDYGLSCTYHDMYVRQKAQKFDCAYFEPPELALCYFARDRPDSREKAIQWMRVRYDFTNTHARRTPDREKQERAFRALWDSDEDGRRDIIDSARNYDLFQTGFVLSYMLSRVRKQQASLFFSQSKKRKLSSYEDHCVSSLTEIADRLLSVDPRDRPPTTECLRICIELQKMCAAAHDSADNKCSRCLRII